MSSTKQRKFSLIIFMGLMLSACASRVDTDVKPKYETKSQIPLNANLVLVRYDFDPTVKRSGSDHLFSRTLTQSLEKWVNTRLHPTGQSGIAQITVRDASIIELPNYQNPEKLEGRLDVTISLVDRHGNVLGQAEAKVRREIEAPNNRERQELTQILITRVIDALDEQMEEAIFKLSSTIPFSSNLPR
jgi:hypothetical protein